MNKLLCIILLTFFISPVFSAVTDSNNSFEIELTQIPPGGEKNSKSHHGLSDGAVTAITLGSVFGGIGALTGIGYYFFKHSPKLTCGFACGEKCHYQLVSLENSEFITKSKHTYLIKAYNEIENKKSEQYLIIPDTSIEPNTYNTVYFEVPYENKEINFKIIQASAAINNKELDSEIFINPKTNHTANIPAKTLKSEEGIVIKQGKISPQKDKLFAINTCYKTLNKHDASKIYAIIIAFEE